MVQSLMKESGHPVSITKLCKWFNVPHSTVYYKSKRRTPKPVDKEVENEMREVIQEFPTYGKRRITVAVRKRLNKAINHKKIHRIIKLNNWQVIKRPKGHRPRVKGMISRIDVINSRWAVDTTHIFCGRDGWCHLTAVIDCCDRNIMGWRLSKRGIAKIAAAALEDAAVLRKINGTNVVLRSDNGLVFGSKAFTKVVNRYGFIQEFITPYTPEQNGMIERFFKTLKEECIWHYNFESVTHAFRIIADWIDFYNNERPHSALNYEAPAVYSKKMVA